MRKYLQVIKNTYAETMEYRLNFILWRVRTVIRLLIVYFLWQAIYQGQYQLFGYKHVEMISYILVSQVVSSLVFATRTNEIGTQIHEGILSNFLLRPMNYIGYHISRDMADKGLNVFFSFIEILLLFFFFRPGVIVQKDPASLFLFLVAIALAIVLYFCISIFLSFLSFWTQESWAPRFLFFVVSDFLSGGLFPLDILPKSLFIALSALPFPYLLFFPLKIYLGRLMINEIIRGFFIEVFWLGFFYFMLRRVWKAGLKIYTAEGR